jgi:peptidoglycan/xylan/chitin deacetylase (PgdA/CDA1 family)
MENFETLEDWTVQSGSLAADENVVYSGTQSARVEVGPGERRARINRRFPNGIDLSAHHLSIAVKLDTPATQSVSVRLDAPDHENVLLMGDYIWRAGWMRIDLGPWKEIGSPDLTDVRDLSIQLYTGGGSEARFHVDSLRRHPRPETGRVVLTFINSFESQYEQVFPALRERGLQGVVSAIPETTEWDRKITMEGLREMHDAGWDVVSSPWRGKHFRVLEPPEQETRIRESKRWLVDNGLVRGSDVLVWPAGRYDRTSLRIASRYHRLGFVGGRGPAGTLTGPLVVGRVSGMDREALEQAVDFAAKYDQVLPLSYRAVGNMFSGIAKKTFLEGLDYALDSGLEVVTATELLATMGDAVESD